MTAKHSPAWIAAQGLFLVGVFAFAFYLADAARESEYIREFAASYGYAGAFLIAFISGFNLFVPVPAVAFMPLFLASGLSFVPAILTVTLGMTLADMVAYFVGRTGHHVIHYSVETRVLGRLERIRERYRWGPMAALFFFAALVPLPTELLLLPLGFLGYRPLLVFPIALAGHAIFNTLYATGVVNLFELL